GLSLIEFAVRSGYKSEPELDRAGRALLNRTTALHLVTRKQEPRRWVSIVLDLFKVYGRWNYVDDWGVSHFHEACALGLRDVVAEFLELGQDPNFATEKFPSPPLNSALSQRSEEHKIVVELLLRAGANPNIADAEGLTGLHLCAGMKPDDRGLAETLFELCPERHRPLRVDARDRSGRTPLHWALYRGNGSVAELLLRRGADPSLPTGDGSTALHVICESRLEIYVRELLFEIIEELQEQVNIDARDNCGNAPLRFAPANGSKKLVEYLIETLFERSHDGRYKPTRIDARDESGNTALYLALARDNWQLVESLLRIGADPNSVNEMGFTPLHFLCWRTELCVKLFLEMCDKQGLQVQIDARDHEGNTPLQLAVANVRPKIVDILLDRGADLSEFVFLTGSRFFEGIALFESLMMLDYPRFKAMVARCLMGVLQCLERRGYELDRSDALMIMTAFAKHGMFAKSAYNFELQICENESRRFFLRWALDPFWRVIHYRLPIEICEMIVKKLRNEDLYNICLTAERLEDEDIKQVSRSKAKDYAPSLAAAAASAALNFFTTCEFGIRHLLMKSKGSLLRPIAAAGMECVQRARRLLLLLLLRRCVSVSRFIPYYYYYYIPLRTTTNINRVRILNNVSIANERYAYTNPPLPFRGVCQPARCGEGTQFSSNYRLRTTTMMCAENLSSIQRMPIHAWMSRLVGLCVRHTRAYIYVHRRLVLCGRENPSAGARESRGHESLKVKHNQYIIARLCWRGVCQSVAREIEREREKSSLYIYLLSEVEMETMKNFNSIRGAYTKIDVLHSIDMNTIEPWMPQLNVSREGGVASSKPHIGLEQSAKHEGNHRWQLVVISQSRTLCLTQRRVKLSSALFKIAQTIRVARGVFLFTVLMGSQLGWSSPNLARFVSGQSSIVVLSSQQVSWCAGLPSLGSVCGAGLGLCSLALLGSRNSIILVLCLMTAKWIMWLFADSAAYVYLFQWICGLSNIMGMNLFSLYLGDVSPADRRGTIISVCLIGHPVGLLVATLVETHLERRHSVPLYLLLTSTAIGLFLWVRDSPYHLIKRGRRQEAELAIAAYFPRANPADKYSEISDYVTRSQSSAASSLKSLALELRDGAVGRGMLVVFLVFAIPQLSGYLVMIFYAEQIFRKSASADLMAPRLFVNCMFAASCLATCCCVRLIDHMGRRKLFIVSSLGTCLSLCGLAVHFHLLEHNDAINSDIMSYLRYLTIVCMPLYMAFSSVGYLSVPAATLSELVPANLRSVAVCLSCLSMAIPGFFVTKLYQPTCDVLGEAWPFWIYAGFTLTALPVSLLLLPETKGKSLLEIQNDLQK
ncbi:unnamed protein product, partial [Trichogramma brassicae]